jgi:hypothetical protein
MGFVIPEGWLKKGARRTDCDECGGKGWDHFEVDGFVCGPEVEKCDTCVPKGFTDAHAVLLHRIDCGCLEVPENVAGKPFYQGRTCMPFPTFSVGGDPE